MKENNKDEYINWLETEIQRMRVTINFLHQSIEPIAKMKLGYDNTYLIESETLGQIEEAFDSVSKRWLDLREFSTSDE